MNLQLLSRLWVLDGISIVGSLNFREVLERNKNTMSQT